MVSRPQLPLKPLKTILVWHQGGLGDLLLAGPALAAVSHSYPEAKLIGVGHPGRWRLLAGTLPLTAAWDSSEAAWSGLFQGRDPSLQFLRNVWPELTWP